MTNTVPPKLKDTRCFTIPCSIGGKEIGKALCDLGAGINLMPLSVFNTLGVGEVNIEDVSVQVNKFVFPPYFIISDFDIDKDIPILLGRPFL